MKLIIDIHEEQYEFIKQGMSIKRVMEYPALMEAICEYIANGTPLPKGHGRLVDERQVVTALVHCDFLKDNVKCGDITKILDIAKIIEADKVESERGNE